MNILKKKSWTRLCHQLKNLGTLGIRDLSEKNLEKIRILIYNKSVVENQSKNKIIMAWNTNNKSVVKCVPRHFCYLKLV